MIEALTKTVQRKTNRGHRMEKTIAVIGGSGFVGRATIEVIAKHNARIIVLCFPKAAIVRPSIVFGAGDNFFNRFASMAMVAPALPLPDGGGMLMQPVYVGDVAAAIAAGLGLTKTKRTMS